MSEREGSVTGAVTCRRCKSTDQVEPVSTRTGWRGRLYINNPAPVDGPGECLTCRLETLKFELGLGWDVHSHSLDSPCGANCAIRGPAGRAWQISLMRAAALDRTRGFLLTKSIDGLPKVNGSFQLQALRMGRFLTQIARRWYEPVPTVQDLVAYLKLAARLEAAGVPRVARPHLLLIFQLFGAAHTSTTGLIEWPHAGERPLDLHSVVATGLSNDGKSIEFWNSWGSGWGDHGIGSVGLDYLAEHFTEAWCRWDGRWGLNWHKVELRELNDAAHLRRTWMIENPVRSQRMLGTRDGDTWFVESFGSYSLATDSGVDIIQIRNGYGLRMGWAYLCAHRDTTESVLMELFVMPVFRGQGLGSVLEGISCDFARSTGSIKMTVLLHEADGKVLANRGAARKFLKSRGYTLLWRDAACPRLAGVAKKQL